MPGIEKLAISRLGANIAVVNGDYSCSKTDTPNLIKHLKVCIYNFNTFSVGFTQR